MKKILTFLFLIFVFGSNLTIVNALEYKQWDLIAVDTVASVDTENFLYTDFYYKSSTDVNGYTSIQFSSIKNVSNEKMPISISVGLFDDEKKNIGVINYCSLDDKSSSYSDMLIDAGKETNFSIKIKPGKYNSIDSSLSDVKYITVMDDNKYCKVGGASNFVGLTVDQMKDGVTNKQLEYNESTKQKQGIIKVVGFVLVVGIIYMLFSSIISSLYMRMYSKWSTYSYVPIVNNYLSFKMSFGPIVGKVLFGVVILCFLIGLLKVKLFIYIGAFCIVISLLINIIKILTNKHEFLYFCSDKVINLKNDDSFDDSKMDNKSSFLYTDSKALEDEDYSNVEFDDITNSEDSVTDIDAFNAEVNDISMGNTKKVFNIDLDEQNDTASSNEYFDMENKKDMSLNDFNDSNDSFEFPNDNIPSEFSNEISFNSNMDTENNDNTDDEDTDLANFFR